MSIRLSMNRIACVGLVATAVFFAPAGVRAQTPTAAQTAEGRALFQEGMTLVEQERWGEALEFFRRSRSLVSRPSTLFNIGSVLSRLGRMGEAITTLEEFLRVGDRRQNPAERAEAERLLADARHAQVHLVLGLNVPDARLEIDGAVVEGHGGERELVLDPGERRFLLSAAGYEDHRFTLSLLPAVARVHRADLREIPTQIVLAITPEPSTVMLDGVNVGARRDLPVTPGSHVILASADGYVSLERTARVSRGERVSLGLSLSRRSRTSITSSPWFWTVVGVVAVGTISGVAAAAITVHEDPYGGNTGTVLSGIRF